MLNWIVAGFYGLTHSSGSDKTNVPFNWTAPADTMTVKFINIVVEAYSQDYNKWTFALEAKGVVSFMLTRLKRG